MRRQCPSNTKWGPRILLKYSIVYIMGKTCPIENCIQGMLDSTVWKLQNFFVIQILREIKFGESRSSKTAILANFGALNFVGLVKFSLQKVQKFIQIKIQNL